MADWKVGVTFGVPVERSGDGAFPLPSRFKIFERFSQVRRQSGVNAVLAGRARAGADGDLQPPLAAVEHARAEVERESEQAVGHPHINRIHRHADGTADAGGVVNRKSKIINGIGGRACIGEPALTGEGRALGASGCEPRTRRA